MEGGTIRKAIIISLGIEGNEHFPEGSPFRLINKLVYWVEF